MKFLLPITLIISTLLATNVEARVNFPPGLTWDYLLGAERDVIARSNKQVVTIDLERAKEFVPYFHKRHQKVVCYFSGGTTENREFDKKEYQKAGIALSGNGDGWGNRWLDIRNKAKLQPLIKKRMQRALSYGCDAVEVDCLGIHNYRNDYTKEDSRKFAQWVAETAHEVGISIGLKNLATVSPKLQPYFDFAVVESCADSRNVCAYYKEFTKRNKAVFMVHYGNLRFQETNAKINLSNSAAVKQLIREQKNSRFSCVFSKDQDLQDNSIDYDCNTGKIINGKGVKQDNKNEETNAKNTEDQIKKTTTTKPVKKSTTTIPVKKTTTTTPVKKSTTTTTTIVKTTTTTPVKKSTTTTTIVKTTTTTIVKTTTTTTDKTTTTTTTTTKVIPSSVKTIEDVELNTESVSTTEAPNTTEIVPTIQTIQTANITSIAEITTITSQPVAQTTTIANQTVANQPILTKVNQSNTANNEPKKEVGNIENNNENEEKSIGTTVALVAAGGVASAAVAGFLFLKNNKKYNNDSYAF